MNVHSNEADAITKLAAGIAKLEMKMKQQLSLTRKHKRKRRQNESVSSTESSVE